MNLLHIFYLNSENDKIKNESMIKNLKKLNCSFTRIEKINENKLSIFFNDEGLVDSWTIEEIDLN